MNKKYMDPEMNVTLFEAVDVITTSNQNGFDGEEDDLENVQKITG